MKKQQVHTKRSGRSKKPRVVPTVGLRTSSARDLYHFLLIISWPRFLGLTALFYLAVNILFALAYFIGGGIANAKPNAFSDVFFFSVQTISTIGYGVMFPDTLYANILVSLETLVGLLGFAMVTGLIFAKFSRPSARILFSEVAVVAPFDGIPSLMFRVANLRHNQILAAQIQVALVRTEVMADGQTMRRIYDLNLHRSQTPIFEFSWTAIHKIESSSPLYGSNQKSFTNNDSETQIVITLIGIDETFSQTIYARHIYQGHEVKWDMRFADILKHDSEGGRFIDYTHFHKVLPIP